MEPKVFLQGYDANELIEAIAQRVAAILMPQLQEKESEEMLTTSDVCKILSCTPQTINAYIKKNKLTPQKIGGKNLFKKEAVLASMNTLKRYDRNIA